MVGQEELKKKFIYLYQTNKLSKVNILIAPKGYGKKEFVKWFSDYISIPYKLYDGKMKSIDELQDDANNQFTNQIYAIENLEYNNSSQNALLKFLENPPLNSVIFILNERVDLLLTTIQNRGITYKLAGYTKEELSNFNPDPLALEVFNNPTELIKCKDINLNELLNITNKIVDKLDIASVSNALKLSNYIKTKDDDKEGYDLNIFIKALRYSLYIKYKETKDEKVREKFILFQDALNQLERNGKYCMDNFIISNYMEIKGWKSKI